MRAEGARPLAGRTIVVTRPRPQAGEFTELLEAEGARVIEFPTIRIVPPEDAEPLRRAAREAAAGRYDWIVFTSRNGAAAFAGALAGQGLGPGAPTGTRICAIGPGTGSALEERSLAPDLIPDSYIAEGVVEALASADALPGKRILLPRAEVARPELPEGLGALGARVDVVTAYRTLPAEAAGVEALRRELEAGRVDAITFTSSSTVRSWHEVLGTLAGGAAVAAIGPVTAGTARELGFSVDVVAREYTIPGLLEACIEHFGRPGR